MNDRSFDLLDVSGEESCVSGGSQLTLPLTPSTKKPSVNAVSIKSVPFWRHFPKAWFLQLEAQFDLAGVTQDQTKYSHLLSALDESVFRELSDLITNPPVKNKYECFKEALISRLSSSENDKFKKLLTDLTLGDSRPSQLLRDMRTLSEGKFSDDVLKSLWLQRLPSNIQAILACSKGSLDDLVVMADKIADVSNRQEIYGIASERDSSPIHRLQKQVTELSEQVTRMSRLLSRPTFQNTKRGNSRNRSSSRQRNFSKDRKFCWYHFKFGDKASKCIKPCSFNDSSSKSTSYTTN